MEGSVRCERDRVRVTAQLIDVRDQAHLWAGRYEQSLHSILALQQALASDIGREVRVRVPPEQQLRRADKRTLDPKAYQLHLKGRHFLNEFSPKSVRRSVDYFRRAVDADPGYAPAYASLAEAYELLPMWIDAPAGDSLALALRAAQQALRLDPDLPDAHASMGLIHANYLYDWRKAEGYFLRALELNPDCPPARQWYAEFLAEMGRIDEGLAVLEWARTH